jgi:peptidoglycan/xylan/chitin deacetylase (PgdA/CDA1 family)
MQIKKYLSFLLVGILVVLPGANLIGAQKASALTGTNLIANPSLETTSTIGNANVTATATVTVTTTTPAPVLNSVVITPLTPVVMVAGTLQLTATPLDQNNVPFTGATTTFTSTDTAITVSTSGLVTGLTATPSGTPALITATSVSGSTTKTATTTVTVVTTPTTTHILTSVVAVPLTPTITPTQTISLSTTPLDQNNAPLESGVTTTYASSDPTVATVSATGLVTGVSAGTASITITSVSPGTSTSTPQGWQSSSWGSNTANFSYLNTGHTGSHSAEVQITAYDNSSGNGGDAKWYFTPVAIQQDTQYVFSDYYEATVPTQVWAIFTIAGTSTPDNQMIGLADPSLTPSTWTQFSTQFSVPLGATNVTIYHLINQIGSLTIDDVNLQPYTPVGFDKARLSLTFDDGYQSTYAQGIPLLASNGFKSTQFIITNDIGVTGYMTKAEIQTNTNKDEIASHTVTHDDLTSPLPTPNTLTTELSNSKTTLQGLVGTTPLVTDLAYPYGLYNNAVATATKTYYSSARGVEDGLNDKNFNPYDIKVQNVFDTTTTAQIKDWVTQAQNTKTWLVLVYHSINSNVTDPVTEGIYNVVPTDSNGLNGNGFDAQLAAIKASGIEVVPMNQALAEINGITTSPILTSVAVSPATSSIAVGGKQTLTATPKDQNGTTFVGATTTFSSGTPAVATVDSTGIVTGVTAGTSTITATSVSGSVTVTGTATVTITETTPTLSSIAITTPATKLSYAIGDTLDLTGLVVTGTNSDGSTLAEPITASNVTGFNSSAAALGQVLTITIGGKTATYAVNIGMVLTPLLSSIAITTPATKLVYTVGDALDLTGLVVTATNSDGSTMAIPVIPSYVSGFNSSVAATDQVLTITFGGKTTTYSVNIVAATTPVTGGGGGGGGSSSGGGTVTGGGGHNSGGGYIIPPIAPTLAINYPQYPNNNFLAGQVLGAQSYHFTLTLRRGARGNEVMELQKFLNNAGYNSGIVDGKFGTKVRLAVINFEKANKLKGDGIVGAKVRALLNQ